MTQTLQRPRRIGQGSAPSLQHLLLRQIVGELPQPFSTVQAKAALTRALEANGWMRPSPNFVSMTLGNWVDRGLLSYQQPEWQRFFRRTDRWLPIRCALVVQNISSQAPRAG